MLKHRVPVPAIVALAAVAIFAVAAMGLGGSLQTARGFSVVCGTTATLIQGTGVDGYSSIWCDNNSTTSVFLGGPGVNTSHICISTNSSNCPRRDLPWDVSLSAQPSCLVATGTVTLKCLSGK